MQPASPPTTPLTTHPPTYPLTSLACQSSSSRREEIKTMVLSLGSIFVDILRLKDGRTRRRIIAAQTFPSIHEDTYCVIIIETSRGKRNAKL
ncbi:hypothetical protein Pcinc_014519 [Petrolisthes cinctipes]|uniref:Uncharacterized protein n=1 Tax=Petrolisthes cinctipes TaxID=88211 RepID=A0AAE1KRQ9_PETCI|nr:hypothetical protein Pcinc_014519 [Petrolisthes cinctipes]